MIIVPHPLFERDILGIAEHVFAVTGDAAAARRRIVEGQELVVRIAEGPDLGALVGEVASGWRVRHGGRGRWITVAYRYDEGTDRLFLAMASVGGQDWLSRVSDRTEFFRPGHITAQGGPDLLLQNGRSSLENDRVGI